MPDLPYVRQELEPRDIKGPRLNLAPLSSAMVDQLLEACLESREALHPFMPWDCWTFAEAAAFVEGAMYARKDGTRFEFAMVRQADDRVVGMLGLKICDPFTPLGELGYWVRSSETGKGYAQEAVLAVVDACAREGAFAQLIAWAATTNYRSRRVLASCEFVPGEIRPLGQCCHETWHDMVKYSRTLRRGLNG